MKLRLLDTEVMSAKYRDAAIDLVARRIRVSYLPGSDQEKDFTEPSNCEGLGRIRHFRRRGGDRWPLNPLPIEPAARALGMLGGEMIRAQVFQNAVCNWRCWYCFVDFDLLRADPKRSRWMGVADLLNLYLSQPEPPAVIDLTGGQPDLTPEWIPWMMTALRDRGLEEEVYLWSDDNLSNDYFWRYLSDNERRQIAAYPKYGRVCCFKGFSAESFCFNTAARAPQFDEQFSLFARLLEVGIDLYAYITLTTPTQEHIDQNIALFVDRLQQIDPLLPLRTVPLEIRLFTPVKGRLNGVKEAALLNQYHAVEAWKEQLDRRFSPTERTMNIVDAAVRGGQGR